jgi:glycosyltransferase involved in cell wall biosynthesis
MKITVFTPTYNRAYIIENLYHSLQRQSFRDFEWLIVDDGSSDNTGEVVAAWQREGNDFPIRYYKKENGGKCRAINYGVDRAQGELFFNVDSDDYLTDDALEKVASWVETLPADGSFCGVVGNLGTAPDQTPNTPLNAPYRDATLLERYADYTPNPIDGERAPVFFTEIQKRYKYPEFEGEKFVTPAVTWNRMAHDGYKVRVFDDIIWVYEYQPDGLTANVGRNFIKNPQGAGLWQREKAAFIGDPLKKKMRMWYTFYCDHTSCEEAYRLTAKQCAEYIGAPLPFMWCVAAIRAVKGMIRK